MRKRKIKKETLQINFLKRENNYVLTGLSRFKNYFRINLTKNYNYVE